MGANKSRGPDEISAAHPTASEEQELLDRLLPSISATSAFFQDHKHPFKHRGAYCSLICLHTPGLLRGISSHSRMCQQSASGDHSLQVPVPMLSRGAACCNAPARTFPGRALQQPADDANEEPERSCTQMLDIACILFQSSLLKLFPSPRSAAEQA
ncbi:hypothetical protein WJX73_000060 [Symbiochloris irregularis]|uniref:Uncharacterized protein n=1 Tax=Symbiochloris irregularis TaxID=706552 RepID=A0AAW1NXT5_9CHLO